jgi:hypothetical protein
MSDQSPEYKLSLRVRTSRRQERRRAASRRSLPRVVLDAFKSGVYILLSFPLAIGYVVFFTTGISTGFGLLVVLAGFVILALVVFAATLAMRLERWLAIHLLSAQIPPLNLRRARADEALAKRSISRSRAMISTLKDYLANASLWKGMALLLIKLPLIIAALVITLIPLSLTISFVLAPLLGQFVNSGWTVDLTSHGAWITSLMAIPSGIVTIGVFDGVGSVLRRDRLLATRARDLRRRRGARGTDLGGHGFGPRLDSGRARRQADRRHHPPPRPGQYRHRPHCRHGRRAAARKRAPARRSESPAGRAS